MKLNLRGLVFSDGSLMFVKQLPIKPSLSCICLAQDLNNHPLWLDYEVKIGEDVELFVSKFGTLKNNYKIAYAKNIG